MKIIFAFLSFFLLSWNGYSQIYNQYFDGADTSASNSMFIELDTVNSNIWQIGPPQKSIFNSAATTPNALVTDTANTYPINDTSVFIINVDYSLFNWGIFALQWKQKIDLENNSDVGEVEFSLDGGLSWENAYDNPYVYNYYGFDIGNIGYWNGGIGFSGVDTSWKDVWLCYDMSFLFQNEALQVRFTFKSDSVNTNQEGWLIDNMSSHITFIHTINENPQEDYIVIFPNETSGELNIQAKKRDGYHIIEEMELINLEGKVVEKFGTCPTKFKIDIGNHAAGLYYLKIKTNIQEEVFPVMLKE